MQKFKSYFWAVLLVLLLPAAASAGYLRDRGDQTSYATMTWEQNQTMKGDLLVEGSLNANSVGQIFYVSDRTDANGADVPQNGKSWKSPFATIDYAIGQCTADRGDTIYVLPGHTAAVIAAGTIDADVAGIRIVGVGNTRERPSITWSTIISADLDIDAANITIKNFYMDMTGIENLAAAIDVNSAGFRLENCEILIADADGLEATAVTADANADRLYIADCDFKSYTTIAAGCEEAVEITGALEHFTFTHNTIQGDFDNAAIYSASVATNLNIGNSIIENFQDDDHAIEFSAAATGWIHDNLLITNAIGTYMDPGSCLLSGNKFADNDLADTGAGSEDMSEGSVFFVTKTITSSSVPNAVAGYSLTSASTGGKLLVEGIYINVGTTSLVAPTTFLIGTDNAAGARMDIEVLVGNSVMSIATANAGANSTVVGDSTVNANGCDFTSTVLETGKVLFISGDDAAGTGSGTADVSIKFRRLVHGANAEAG